MHILVILLGATLLYYLQYLLYRYRWDKHLTVTLQFSSNHSIEGEQLSLTETIRNQKLLPLPIVRVKFMFSRNLIFADSPNSNISDYFYRDDLISILMYQQLTKRLDFTCSHRGFYTIGQADIVCNDVFLSVSLAKHMSVKEFLYVYPRQLEDSLIQIPFQKMLGTVLTKRFYNEDPFEFAGIREYQPYDSMKNINWKASAKTGNLKVNVHDYTASQQISIFLNLEAAALLNHDDLMEESIRLAATYTNAFLQAGIPVALYTNGLDIISKEPITVTGGCGNTHMKKVNEALARIDLSLNAPAFLNFISPILNATGKQEYLLFISTYQKKDFQHRLLQLKKEQKDFTWIVPLDSSLSNDILPALQTDSFPYQLSETFD